MVSGRLFTNNLGQIVFADQDFLCLMRLPAPEAVAGEPLFKVLGVEPRVIKPHLERLLKTGRLEAETFKTTTPEQNELLLAISGEATYDLNGMYIGADIVVRETSPNTISKDKIEEEPEILRTKPHLNDCAVEANNVFLQLYFTTHIKALYILLSRLIGIKVQGNLDKLINETAHKTGSALAIKAGVFTAALDEMKPSIYRKLLNATVEYASNMMGRRIVLAELEKTDAQMHEGLIVLATQAGMRDFFLH